MKNRMLIWFCVILTVISTSCCSSTKNEKPEGRYVAVNPPELGEAVVQEILFKNDTLTMRSGTLSQEVDYSTDGEKLILHTKFGDFDYSFEWKEDRIMLDDLEYIREDEK